MTDLLLTHGYFLWEDEKEREIMKPYAPLGLLYISAYLKRAGFDVETFDTTFSDRESLVALPGARLPHVGPFGALSVEWRIRIP